MLFNTFATFRFFVSSTSSNRLSSAFMRKKITRRDHWIVPFLFFFFFFKVEESWEIKSKWGMSCIVLHKRVSKRKVRIFFYSLDIYGRCERTCVDLYVCMIVSCHLSSDVVYQVSSSKKSHDGKKKKERERERDIYNI